MEALHENQTNENQLTANQIKGYDLKKPIGSGGFGAVYLAYQTAIGREVAVKIILPDYASHPEFIRRFESEAHVIARLEHPHITPLHDFWRDPKGAYLVMRFLKGGSVRDALREGAYDLASASRLLDQIASALDFAHRHNVIHRDIKPGNILLDEDGNAYLADFGIAKDLGQRDANTAAEAIVGSLDYISPEQARSEPVTPRTDIYSLGVTLYELITGQHPFVEFSSIERLYKHINDSLPFINELPAEVCASVNAVIQTATAKNPDKRYPDVLAMAAAFREAVGRADAENELSIVEQLTLREHEILSLIVDGLSNQEIAAKLVVTLTTVKWHITQLYKKLGVRSRVQAIVRARELDLIVKGGDSDVFPSIGVPSTSVSLPEPENPYKGLHAFQTSDSRDFFGREDLTAKLISRMEEQHAFYRFLAIVGPSGSGKSSLVKAGLIPALWRGALSGSERWFVVDMMPGSHPLDMLETALIRVAANHTANLREQLQRDNRGLLRVADIILPGDDTQLLIVVDQFEEVFTLVDDEATRQHFLDLLRVAVSDVRSRVRIVVTLRADYYDRPLHYPEFGEILRSRMETVLPLSAKGLELAIRAPAERVGVTFESGLIAQIVGDINYQTGALPLLQYALTELFDRREGRVMTHNAYRQVGGAVGALANRADEVYNSLQPDAQSLTRQMFMRLVTLGEGAEDTRRRTAHAELLSLTKQVDAMEEIIDQFAAYRLLSLDHDSETRQPTVEVAHEAILREWGRLRQWLNDSREDIRHERAITRAADDWKAHNGDSSYLLRGSRLEQTEKWQQSTELVLTPLEREFITASLQQRDKDEQAEIRRQQRESALERRSYTFLRGLVAVFAVAVIVAVGFSLFALERDRQSQRSAAEFRSVALSFAAKEALDNGQPDAALALAREATRMEQPPLAAEQTFFNVSTSTWIQKRFAVSRDRVWDAVYHPDGKRIVTTSWDGRAVLWDITNGEALQSIQRDGRPLHVAVHPDGDLVVIGGRDGHLQFWELTTNEVTDVIEGGVANQMSPIFTRDGSLMLISSHDGRIDIWDMQTRQIIRSFEAHDTRVQSIAFNADESLLLTGSEDGSAKIWDFETGELLQTLIFPGSVSRGIPVGTAWVWEAQFLPDGERILSVDGNGVMILWHWRTGEILRSLEVEQGAQIHDMALSPDKKTMLIVIGDPHSQVQHIDVETGNLIQVYHGHSQRINNIDLSPDGTHFLTASLDGTANIWPLNWEGAQMTALIPAGKAIAWHPTRSLAAVVGASNDNDGVIRLVNVDTGMLEQEFAGQSTGILSLAFTPDGRYLLAGDNIPEEGYPVGVWDVETGEHVSTLPGQGAGLTLAISPDGRYVAGGGWETALVALWDLTTKEPLHAASAHADWVTSLVFDPDGRTFYSSGRDGRVIQWAGHTGEMVRTFAQIPVAVWDIDLNSDGTRLVAALEDHTAVVWDILTGEALLVLGGHAAALENVEFSLDDRTIMTSGLDGRIMLWDARSGEVLRAYVGSVDTDNPQDFQAQFSPDGQHILSGANDVVFVWDASPWAMDLETWVEANRYIPDFTCEQRATYRITPLCEPDED